MVAHWSGWTVAHWRGSMVAGLCLSASLLPAAVRADGLDMTQGGPIQITARDGIDWRQNEKVVIANGDARAVRGDVTVTADHLYAWYRKKGENVNAPEPAAPSSSGEPDTEGNEVYRLRADGNVHIYNPTDQAWSDQATYDLDQAVMVMTGHALKLTTPDDTLTARDTLEYWPQKHMSVARGDAVLVTNDARRVSADTLVAYTLDQNSGQAGAKPPAPAPVAPSPATTGRPAPAGGSMEAMVGKLQRAEAFGNVTVRTLTDIVTGDRGVYVPDTDIAHLGGHVRITRGLNQVNGSEAVVNMKTGVATLLSGENGRVAGLVVPNDQNGLPPDSDQQGKAPRPPAKAGATP
jgi:lipopolysaccharide export system protein LptA